MRRTPLQLKPLESKPITPREILPLATQALAKVRGGQSTGEPIAAFITFGGYDTTDG
jgi:hypothetical protein